MNADKKHKRILIFEVNWLGDVLFSTPLLRAVREKFKDAYIACLTVPRAKEVLEYNPAIDEIIIYDENGLHAGLIGKIRLILSLRKKRFDLAILLHRSFTRALITYLSGIRERTGYATKKREILLTRPVEVPEEELHKVEYFLRIAKSIGCDISSKDYDFFISDKERGYIKSELSKEGVSDKDTLLVINPGGNWEPKRWSEEKFADLSDRLAVRHGLKVAASGAGKDLGRIMRIKKKMKTPLAVFAGRTGLKELGALMQRADFVISGDSGPMHIAVAVGSNVIALFGPTSPALTGPYGNGSYEVLQKDVGCEVPCYEFSCDNYKCMQAITVEDVLWVFEGMYKKCKP